MSANVIDPLRPASSLMKITGIMNMSGSAIAAAFFCLVGVASAKGLFLFCAVLAAAAFIASFQIFSASRAMTGRYTLKSCQFASVLAVFSGPVGLIAGVTSLRALRRPEVQASFNS